MNIEFLTKMPKDDQVKCLIVVTVALFVTSAVFGLCYAFGMGMLALYAGILVFALSVSLALLDVAVLYKDSKKTGKPRVSSRDYEVAVFRAYCESLKPTPESEMFKLAARR